MNDPLDSAIPVGSGPGTTVPPSSTPPPAVASTVRGSDKIWAILSHLSGFISLFILLPLIVYLAMRNESAYAADNAKEALNFHLSLLIYALGCGLLALTIIAAPLAAIIGGCMAIGYIILSIIAAIRAYEGSVYQYPLTLRFVK
jgi:uncharacterized Tic20 family protein